MKIGLGRRRRCGTGPAPCSSAPPGRAARPAAAGGAQVAQGLVVHREEAAWWRRTPAPCWRWWPGRPGSSWPRPGPKNSTNFSTTPLLAQDLGDGQHQVGGGDALAQLAGQAQADHLGDAACRGAGPACAASASMPPTPQPSTPRPLIMVVWESVPDQRVGEGHRLAPSLSCVITHLGQVLQVDLVARCRWPAAPRGSSGRPAGPSAGTRSARRLRWNSSSALAASASGRGEAVDLHRVVDHQVHRHQRVDAARVAAQLRPRRRASPPGPPRPARR